MSRGLQDEGRVEPTYSREYVDFARPTKAYREDWHACVLIPAGAYAPIVDKVGDERGACIIIEWQGEELAVDVEDLEEPDEGNDKTG